MMNSFLWAVSLNKYISVLAFPLNFFPVFGEAKSFLLEGGHRAICSYVL